MSAKKAAVKPKDNAEEVLFIGDKVSDLRYLEIIDRILAKKGLVILKGGLKYNRKMVDLAKRFHKNFTIEYKMEKFTGKKGDQMEGLGLYLKITK
jgi:2-hydroxy-3-keto-5-methylthiopentenyl-1-phosphate phosphatase